MKLRPYWRYAGHARRGLRQSKEDWWIVVGAAVPELAGRAPPQHLTVSSSKIAQVCSSRKLTDFAVRPEPRFTAVVLGALLSHWYRYTRVAKKSSLDPST